MRSLCILFIIISLLFSSTSGSYADKQVIAKDGMEAFYLYEGDIEINYNLIPENDLLYEDECVYKDYCYRAYYDKWSFFYDCEKTIVVLTYEDDVYTTVKTAYLKKLQTNEINTIDYNGYVFKENLDVGMGQFPKSFGMFGYNDELNTLIFLGFTSDDQPLDESNVQDNFGEFLRIYFGDIYDFDEHSIIHIRGLYNNQGTKQSD